MPESGAIRASQNCLHPADQKIFRASREEKEKGKGKSQANIVEKMKDVDDLCAMISDCNLVGSQGVVSRLRCHVTYLLCERSLINVHSAEYNKD